MADVQRMHKVLPDVFIAVPRQAADEGFHCVVLFYTDAEKYLFYSALEGSGGNIKIFLGNCA